jgi:KUP system potassium uptake protein
VLATAATVIASQALISAVFSLTRQAVQLGYWPRVRVVHTSADEEGQVYVPGFNWTVMGATIALVLAFRSSGALAAAFGLAVAGTMAITTLLFAVVARARWAWPRPAIAAFLAVFLTVDIGFIAANALKIEDGGWVPLAIGAGMFTLMQVWARGRALLRAQLEARAFALPAFLESFGLAPPVRVPGAAVFLTATPETAPLALLHYLKHAKSLHEQVVILSVLTEDAPHVAAADRVSVEGYAHGFWRVIGRYGFMESPDIPALLREAEAHGLVLPARTYFLGRESVIATRGRWRRWTYFVFAVMHRNARPAADFFGLPPNQVMEVGAQVEL